MQRGGDAKERKGNERKGKALLRQDSHTHTCSSNTAAAFAFTTLQELCRVTSLNSGWTLEIKTQPKKEKDEAPSSELAKALLLQHQSQDKNKSKRERPHHCFAAPFV